jgi:transcriptional regulator with XRE-family HTH domain
MKPEQTFGEVIKDRRLTLGLTQRQLAEILGVKGSHIAYLESGRRKPSIILLKQLAEKLQLNCTRLFLLAHPEAAAFLSCNSMPKKPENPASAWERFVNDRTLHAKYQITPRELEALKHLSLLGYVLTEREFLAVLTLVRQSEDL